MLVAVGARRDALRSGFVTYRAAVAAISREVSDPSAGDHEDASSYHHLPAGADESFAQLPYFRNCDKFRDN